MNTRNKGEVKIKGYLGGFACIWPWFPPKMKFWHHFNGYKNTRNLDSAFDYPVNHKRTVMKKITLLALTALVIAATSCNRYITTYEAANGKAKCGKYIK